MRTFRAYETSDGTIHKSLLDANRHADKLYGDQLTKMAHELVKVDKYSDMLDKLDGLKGPMRLLLRLSDDMQLEQPDSNGDYI